MPRKTIWECFSSSQGLAAELQANGLCHRNYKLYTSMENAQGILLSGNLYLSDGQGWNDKDDRKALRDQRCNNDRIFAKCFSCSTEESVAMWMLYSDGLGRHGAMLNFYAATLEALCKSETVELGYFYDHQFNKIGTYRPASVFLTDVIYKSGTSYLSLGETHLGMPGNKNKNSKAGTDKKVKIAREEILEKLEDKNVFCKDYAWSYEKEARLVVRISCADIMDAEDRFQRLKNNDKHLKKSDPPIMLKMQIPEDQLRKLRKLRNNRLITSPVYEGNSDYGKDSDLHVEWDL